jgi:hypothetical protein
VPVGLREIPAERDALVHRFIDDFDAMLNVGWVRERFNDYLL